MTVLFFLIAIVILVGIHELGHYSAAKLCGVQVLRFSIGFGRALWKSKPKNPTETEWVISSIPLGGYVKMLDGRDPSQTLTNDNCSMAFDRQKLWKRSFIVAAGPAANFILAFFLFTVIYVSGVTQVKPILDQPPINSVASKLGVNSGDEVINWNIGDKSDSMNSYNEGDLISWNRLRWKLLKSTLLESPIELLMKSSKDGHKYTISISKNELSQIDLKGDIYTQLGFLPQIPNKSLTYELELPILSATYYAFERVWDISVISLVNVIDLISGKASLSQISGPVTIADMAGKSAKVGFQAFLGFLALVSISLGLLNLLPFPLLDGGQLMYDLWEFITGHKVPVEIQGFLQKIGILGLLLLTCYAFFNDISRLFSG